MCLSNCANFVYSFHIIVVLAVIVVLVCFDYSTTRPLTAKRSYICIISLFEKTAFLDLKFNQVGSVLYFMCDVFNTREIFHIKHFSDEIVLYLLSYVPFCRYDFFAPTVEVLSILLYSYIIKEKCFINT